jgi:hypothetical protein
MTNNLPKHQRDTIPAVVTKALAAIFIWFAKEYRNLKAYLLLNNEEIYALFMFSDRWAWTPFLELEDWARRSDISQKSLQDMLDKFVSIKIMRYRGRDGKTIPPEQRFSQDAEYRSPHFSIW